MSKTNIEWATHTINFYDWACTAVSAECDHCYARTLAGRYGKNFDKTPEWREKAVNEWRSLPPDSVAFINSMSDTWHEGVALETIQHLYAVLAERPDVTALVLTKRIGRWRKHRNDVPELPNVWAGTSIGLAETAFRARYLSEVPAAGRFISAEPLLADISATHHLRVAVEGGLIDWIISGAESGGQRRPFNPDWARALRDLCAQHNVTFMHKQGSAFKPGQNRELDGRTHDDKPDFAAHAARTRADIIGHLDAAERALTRARNMQRDGDRSGLLSNLATANATLEFISVYSPDYGPRAQLLRDAADQIVRPLEAPDAKP